MARSRADEFLERAAERTRAAARGGRRLGGLGVCRHDALYPEALAALGDPPGVLFGRGGDPGLLAAFSAEETVTIVGSRRPSSYGRELATELGREVASAGFAVVSGMAMGIDSSAHRGALEAGGLTIAVLGTGVDVPYPPRHTRLYEEIVERGLVGSASCRRARPRAAGPSRLATGSWPRSAG